MKRILVPIDFHSSSINALQYALDNHPNGNVTILHVISGVLDENYPHLTKGLPKDEAVTATIHKLVQEKLRFSKEVNIEIKVLFGMVARQVIKYLAEVDFDLCYVGIRENKDAVDRWLGTNALAIIKQAEIPVYGIPERAVFKGYDKVLVAGDDHLQSDKHLAFILTWAQRNQAFVKILHVGENYQLEKQHIVERFFENKPPHISFEIAQTSSKSVPDALLSAAYNLPADLLILIPDQQTFFNSLFFKSASKEILAKTQIPILFINQKNEQS